MFDFLISRENEKLIWVFVLTLLFSPTRPNRIEMFDKVKPLYNGN